VKGVFADTFYWIALTDPADPQFWEASALNDQLTGTTIFTTDEVLSEFLTFFAGHSRLRDRAARSVGILLSAPRCVCHSTEPRVLSCRAGSVSGEARQRVQPGRLHLHANHAARRTHRGPDKRPAFRARGFSRPVPVRAASNPPPCSSVPSVVIS